MLEGREKRESQRNTARDRDGARQRETETELSIFSPPDLQLHHASLFLGITWHSPRVSLFIRTPVLLVLTFIRFLYKVCFPSRAEAQDTTAGLSTFLTCIRFLPSVRLLLILLERMIPEGFSTCNALMRLNFSLITLMHSKIYNPVWRF